MRIWHHALSGLMLLAALAATATCTKVLDLNDHVDAAAAMCGCPGPQADKHCTQTVSEGLDNAFVDDREKWLSSFIDDGCQFSCDNAVDCYNQPPVCKDKRPGCECCVYHDETPECTGPSCKACMTCSESIAGADISLPDRSNLCASSKRVLDELTYCVCNNCSNSCGAFCNTAGMVGCSICITMNCSSFLNACQADVSQP